MAKGAAARPARRRAAPKKSIVDDDYDSDEFGGKEHHIPNHYNRGKAPAEESDVHESSPPASINVDELANSILTGIMGHIHATKAPINERSKASGFLAGFRTIVANALQQQGVHGQARDESDDEDETSVERRSFADVVQELPQRTHRRRLLDRQKISVICDIIEAPPSISKRAPLRTDDESIFDPSLLDGPYRRAKSVLSHLTEALAGMMAPSNPKALLDIFMTESVAKGDHALCENVLELYLTGDTSTAAVAGSLLAKSYTNADLQEMINARVGHSDNEENEESNGMDIEGEDAGSGGEDDGIRRARKTMGWWRFRTLRNLWGVIVEGKPIPRRVYSFRVDPEKLARATEYLMTVLHVLPGRSRSVKLDDQVISNLPVYDRGGHSIIGLFKQYKEDVGEEDAIGEDTFTTLIKLLTKKGEAKAGLSAYYTRFRHACATFDEIFDFLESMEEVKELDGIEILREDAGTPQKVPDDIKTLKEWFVTRVKRFVSWEYGNDHVDLLSNERCHCARDALNRDIPPTRRQRKNHGDDGRCSNVNGHEHGDNVCEQCMKLFSFATEAGPVAKVLDNIDSKLEDAGVSLEGEVKTRYNSARKVLPKLQHEIKRYAAHHVRWKVQRTGYSKLQYELDPEEVIVVLDHKQKIISMRNREGQIEYFGKKGMSFCGANIIRKVVKGGVVGYEHSYFDFIIDGYQDQDHIQVAAIIQIMLDEVKKKFPDVKRILLKTDNASCMSSHNNIPFIYHLNKEIKEKHGDYQVARWTNMEAYTGKDFIDTHFSFINRRLEAYVNNGNNVTTQQEIFKALSWKNGLAGTTTYVLDFTGLQSLPYVEKTKNVRGKKPAATTQQNSTQFKIKTGVKSTHDIIFEEDEVLVYRYTGVTTAEVVKDALLDQAKTAVLDVCIKIQPVTNSLFKYESSIPALFVKEKCQENMGEVAAATGNTNEANPTPAPANTELAAEAAEADNADIVPPPAAKRTKYSAITTAMEYHSINFGDNADHSNNQGLTLIPTTGNSKVSAEEIKAALESLNHGWANKDFTHEQKSISINTLKRLHFLEERGRKNKNLRTTQDGAFEDVRRWDKMPDFCERLYCTLAHVKSIIDMDTDGREKLIKEAEDANNTANALTIAIPEGAVEEAEEALEGAEAEEEALVDEGDEGDSASAAEQQPNAAAMDLDSADVGGSDKSLPASRSGRARAIPGRYLV